METHAGLTIADYVVIGIMLLIPLGIGIFFAFLDRKKSSREEYLLGGRQMSLLPVTLSLFVTYQSAIGLMGLPHEVYSYGSMYCIIYAGCSLSYIVGYFIMIPVMYPLKLTSLYEYLSLRYDSQNVRLLSTLIGILQNIFYMAIALFSPALALQTTTSLPFWMSIVIVGITGTVYTAIGGIKSVVWTDTFQTLIVFVGIFMVLIKGCMFVGGVDEMVSIARAGGRLSFDTISPDPRTRHSWWGQLGGAGVMWLINIFNQSTLQRISSMKSKRDASACFLLNVPLMLGYGFIMMCVGLVMYAYFHTQNCEPIQAGLINDGNQMIPFFVLYVLQDLPGMPGLFMSTLFSGSLSTISSGLSAVSANTVEDILGNSLRKMKETTVTRITQAISLVYGALIIGLAYGIKSVKGPVTQMALSVFGACGGPIVGMFLMGVTVPWANKFGAGIGGSVALILNLSIAICGQIYGKKPRRLPAFSTESCPRPVNSTYTTLFNGYSSMNDSIANTSLTTGTASSSIYTNVFSTTTHVPQTSNTQYDNGFFLFDISYEWYGVIGTFVCVTIGLAVSYLTRGYVKTSPDPGLLIPFCRRWCTVTQSSDIDMKKVNLGAGDKVLAVKNGTKTENEKIPNNH